MSFGRSGFSRDPCAIEDGRFGIGGGGFIRGLWDLEGRGSGRKPLLPRSGFSRDPCVIEGGRFGIVGAASSVAFGILKAGVRGESPSYKKNDVFG
jgi:hypothetical protein